MPLRDQPLIISLHRTRRNGERAHGNEHGDPVRTHRRTAS
jgi:hypothetical protein